MRSVRYLASVVKAGYLKMKVEGDRSGTGTNCC